MPRNSQASVEVPTQDYPYESGAVGRASTRAVVVETPINILFGGVGFAVMMATPEDLEDFAYGFALTEGIIETAEQVRGVEIVEAAEGLKLNISLAGERMSAHLARARALAGRTGCGLCGIDDLAHLPKARRAASPGAPIAPEAVKTALAAVEAAQILNARTRAAHGAAWCDRSGAVIVLREDVGRHNALDKLIGALIRRRIDLDGGFLVITSRCSFEMVAKAAVLGASTLVAVSAPTSLALARAEACGLRLIALARADHATLFASDGIAATAPGDGGLAA